MTLTGTWISFSLLRASSPPGCGSPLAFQVALMRMTCRSSLLPVSNESFMCAMMDVLGIALEPKVVISKFGLLPKSLDLVQSLRLGVRDFLVLLYLCSPPPLSTMDPR